MATKPKKKQTFVTPLSSKYFFPAIDFHNIANRSPGLVDVYHYETGQYVYVNNAIKHTLGFEPTDMLKGGLPFFISHIHPDDLAQSRDKNAEASKAVEQLSPGVDDTRPFASFEYRVQHKDGHYVWLHTDASVFSRSPTGKLEYVINTCVDITEQKSAEEKLRNAKDEFVFIVSHQLRAPATSVKQYLSMLMKSYAGKPTDEQMEMLRAAYDSNERQLAIISDLLNMARIDAGKVKPHKSKYDLTVIVKHAVAEQQEKYAARKQILQFTHGRAPVNVQVDERLLRMVIENLLDNASKYSPEGKNVEVKLSAREGKAILEVKDHGLGISKADQQKLFQKFSRIENDHTFHIAGTGLGLYWAKKVVDLHYGTITLRSSKKNGTVFTVSLPLTK